jgi:biopolymer transport protein ExbB/TolQ
MPELSIGTDFALTVGTLIFSGGIAWGLAKARENSTQEQFKSHDNQIQQQFMSHNERLDEVDNRLSDFHQDMSHEVEKLRQWRHTHEKESTETRLGIEQEFHKVDLKVAENTARFTNALEKVSEILERIKALEHKLDRKVDRRNQQ